MDWASFIEFQKKLRAEDLTLAQAMARVPEWARTDDDLKHLAVWEEFPQMDLSKDSEMVADWFTEALKNLKKAPDVDMVNIALGESPEIFSVAGYKYTGGQAKIDELIELLRIPGEGWMDAIDWDDIEVLIYKKTKKLPSGWYDWYEKYSMSDKPKVDRVNSDFFYILWGILANQTVDHVLRHGGLDIAGIVGNRTKVPVMIGFEEAEWYIGSLTPEGWQDP